MPPIVKEHIESKNNNPENTIATITSNGTHSDETTVSLFYKKTFKKAGFMLVSGVN